MQSYTAMEHVCICGPKQSCFFQWTRMRRKRRKWRTRSELQCSLRSNAAELYSWSKATVYFQLTRRRGKRWRKSKWKRKWSQLQCSSHVLSVLPSFSMFSHPLCSLSSPILPSSLFSQFSRPHCSLSSPVLTVLSVLMFSLQFSCPLCSLSSLCSLLSLCSPVLTVVSVLPSLLFSRPPCSLSSPVFSVLPSPQFSRPLLSPSTKFAWFSLSLSLLIVRFLSFLLFSNFHSFCLIFSLCTTKLSGKWTLFEFNVLQKIIYLQIENDVNVNPDDLYTAYQQIFDFVQHPASLHIYFWEQSLYSKSLANFSDI